MYFSICGELESIKSAKLRRKEQSVIRNSFYFFFFFFGLKFKNLPLNMNSSREKWTNGKFANFIANVLTLVMAALAFHVIMKIDTAIQSHSSLLWFNIAV